MKMPNVFFIEKTKDSSVVLKIVIIAYAVVAAAAAAFAVYKLFGEKIKAKLCTKVLGSVDIDGDGEADATLLDTDGDGEVDTIVFEASKEA